MSHNAILLGNCQINQLIVCIDFNGVQTFFEFSIESSAEAVTLLNICVSVIARVLTKTIESLGILDNRTSPLSKSQELIQFPFHKTLWNMVTPKCILEFIPSDNMISREHAMVVIPPKTRRTAKLLCGKESLISLRTWHWK